MGDGHVMWLPWLGQSWDVVWLLGVALWPVGAGRVAVGEKGVSLLDIFSCSSIIITYSLCSSLVWCFVLPKLNVLGVELFIWADLPRCRIRSVPCLMITDSQRKEFCLVQSHLMLHLSFCGVLAVGSICSVTEKVLRQSQRECGWCVFASSTWGLITIYAPCWITGFSCSIHVIKLFLRLCCAPQCGFPPPTDVQCPVMYLS